MPDVNRQSRWFLGILAVFVLAPLVVGLLLALTAPFFSDFSSSRWVGASRLEVRVQVADANSIEPITGAKVTIFDGPSTPFDGLSGFDRERTNKQEGVTDEDGFAIFTHRFRAFGSDSRFKSTGVVMTSSAWVSIEAPGYSTIIVPVSEEVRGRDIKNQSPLYVTVLMGKPEE